MYKLFWALSCMVFALLNNVKPYLAATIPFQDDGYYTSTLGEDDPAAIYASFFSTAEELYQPCSPSYINPPKIYIPDNTAVGSPTIGDLYTYFLPVSTSTFAECNKPIEEGKLVALIAPISGHITTDPANSYWSSYMEFEGSVGAMNCRFVIEDMECWYCCVGHTKTASGGYRHQYVEAEDYSATMSKGQFLGLANANTKITIYVNDRVVSFEEFFGGENGKGLKPGVDFSGCTLDTTKSFPDSTTEA